MPSCNVSGIIPAGSRMEQGRALCVWGDAGWGGLVRDRKYRHGHFDDRLVDACVQMFR